MLKVIQLAGEGNTFYITEEGQFISRPYTYQQAINQFKVLRRDLDIQQVMNLVRDSLPVDLIYDPDPETALKIGKNAIGEANFNLYTAPIWFEQTRGKKKEDAVLNIYLPLFKKLFSGAGDEILNWLANIVQNRRNHLIPVVIGQPGVILGPIIERLIDSSNFFRTYRMPTNSELLYKQVVHWREAVLREPQQHEAFHALFGEHLNFLLTTNKEDAVIPLYDDERLWLIHVNENVKVEEEEEVLLADGNIRALWLYLRSMDCTIQYARPITKQLARTISQTLKPWERKILREWCQNHKADSFEDVALWISKECAGLVITPADCIALAEKSTQLRKAGNSAYGAIKILNPDDKGSSDFYLEVTHGPAK